MWGHGAYGGKGSLSLLSDRLTSGVVNVQYSRCIVLCRYGSLTRLSVSSIPLLFPYPASGTQQRCDWVGGRVLDELR